MAAKYFVTRSAVQPPNTDFDAAMQHQEIGPFGSFDQARAEFVRWLCEKIEDSADAPEHKIQRSFLPQYARLAVTVMQATPDQGIFEAEGIRWVIRSIGR